MSQMAAGGADPIDMRQRIQRHPPVQHRRIVAQFRSHPGVGEFVRGREYPQQQDVENGFLKVQVHGLPVAYLRRITAAQSPNSATTATNGMTADAPTSAIVRVAVEFRAAGVFVGA